ncbi:hypothetical protein [Dehalococcoides mccartyi]|uniref:hypothetical protein n=1 Tax=Dehalococcoides mccartyi TaxID=61435 RepID=UPI00155E84CE|nr:hypothetical protein [Dehalococcoides mccartyi]
MSGEMVRAILDGKKTQTRRVIKIPCYYSAWQIDNAVPHNSINNDGYCYLKILHDEDSDNAGGRIHCPYGTIGDRLWVKETFQTFRKDTAEEANNKFIAGQNLKSVNDLIEWGHMPSGHGELGILYAADFGSWAYNTDSDLKPWKSSIFMPRKYSRILLEITEIRVQRIQDISEPDAQAEGTKYFGDIDYSRGITYRKRYSELWDKINAKRGHEWANNDWVWGIEFKKVETK